MPAIKLSVDSQQFSLLFQQKYAPPYLQVIGIGQHRGKVKLSNSKNAVLANFSPSRLFTSAHETALIPSSLVSLLQMLFLSPKLFYCAYSKLNRRSIES